MLRDNNEDLRHEAIDALDLRFAELRLASPQAMARIREEMEQGGVCHPLLVSDSVEEKKLVVIDGFKRVRAARELGHTQVAVRVLHLSAVPAQVAIVQANAPRRGLSDFEEGLVVQRLHRQHGLSQVDIGTLLGRHKTWVCRRLCLVEGLESGVQEDLRLGLVSTSVAREVVRLPRCNQGPAARAIAAHRLSSRQATQFVRVLSVVEPSERDEVLEHPLSHLPQRRDADRYPDDPRLSAAGNRVRQHLLRFRAASNRVIESLRGHASRRFPEAELEVLARIGEEVMTSARHALTRVERFLAPRTEKEDVGSRASAVAGV